MREILFRGKRIDNGEWVYGSGVYLNAGAALAFIMVDGGTDEGSRKYVIPQTVGQFTGLKDKNGKDIYEGDIVEYKWRSGSNWSTSRGVVNYKAPEWLVDEDRFVDDGDEQVIEVKDHEVIGNIYEHQHLLQAATPNS